MCVKLIPWVVCLFPSRERAQAAASASDPSQQQTTTEQKEEEPSAAAPAPAAAPVAPKFSNKSALKTYEEAAGKSPSLPKSAITPEPEPTPAPAAAQVGLIQTID